VPTNDKIHQKILFCLVILKIIILAFVVVLANNNANAQTFDDRTFYEIEKSNSKFFESSHIEVGNHPVFIESNDRNIYVANEDSNTISVINKYTDTKIKDIAVGESPKVIDSDDLNDRLYVINAGSDSISVISTKNNTKIKDIAVGDRPVDIENSGKKLYVANLLSDSISVISTKNNTKIKDIAVGDRPVDIDYDGDRLYVANDGSDFISVISTKNDTKIKDIRVKKASYLVYSDENTIYVNSYGSDSLSVISTENYTKIKDIKIGAQPSFIYSDKNTIYVGSFDSPYLSIISKDTFTKIKDIKVGDFPRNIENFGSRRLYVANYGSDSISVISTQNYTKIKDIKIGGHPNFIHQDGNTIYVAKSDSDSISLIDVRTAKIVAGITVRVNPLNSGYVECDEVIPPTGQYFYLYSGTNCIAKQNKGFEFLSWEEYITNNSTQVLKVSSPNSELESIKHFFSIKSEEPEAILNVTKFGTFIANFKELPPPLPPEYVATLFGVVVTAFISSWLTLTIIGWRKAKRHQHKLNDYENKLEDMDKGRKIRQKRHFKSK
jgi:YVTN family beta-propeller protein